MSLIDATPRHLHSAAAWCESTAAHDFVIKLLESADKNGELTLHPTNLDEIGILCQMGVVGWVTTPNGPYKPGPWVITKAGKAALMKGEGKCGFLITRTATEIVASS